MKSVSDIQDQTNKAVTLIAFTGTSPGAPLIGGQDPTSSRTLDVLWAGSTQAMADQFQDGEVRKLKITLQNPLIILDETRKGIYGDMSHARIAQKVHSDVIAGQAAWDGIVFEDTADGMEVADVIVVFPREGSVDHAVEVLGVLTYAENGEPGVTSGFFDVKDVVVSQDAEDPHDEIHQAALDETGFWGRRGAGSIVMSRETGRILLAHRSKDVLEPHTWGTWGGAIDTEESTMAAAMRELVQESGVNQQVDLIPLLVFASGDFRYHNHLAIVEKEFEPTLNWETQGFIWTDPSSLPDPLHPGLKALMDDTASAQVIRAYANFAVMDAAVKRVSSTRATFSHEPLNSKSKAQLWTGPAYRALNSNPPAAVSVSDLLAYEAEALGNDDIQDLGLKSAADLGLVLDNIPASESIWVTKSRELARQYGSDEDIREVKTEGWTVIVDLGDEGSLLVRDPQMQSKLENVSLKEAPSSRMRP